LKKAVKWIGTSGTALDLGTSYAQKKMYSESVAESEIGMKLRGDGHGTALEEAYKSSGYQASCGRRSSVIAGRPEERPAYGIAIRYARMGKK